jgi:hypothetical protein
MLDIIYILVALCLFGTIIWAFVTYVTIPGPFAWVKGILTFVLIVLMCYFIWDQFLGTHLTESSTHFRHLKS